MADDHKPYYADDEQPEDLLPEEVLPPTPSPNSMDEIVKNIPQIAQKPDFKGQGVALWKIIVGISVLATIIAAYPVIQPLLPTPLAGEPAIIEGENREVLVLVAQFDAGNDIRLPDVRHNFANIVETAIENLDDQVTARVLRIPEIVTSHDQARAESDRYNATLVIWGEVFPRELTAKYTLTPRWSVIHTEPGETSIAVSTIDELDTIVSFEGGDTEFILNLVLGQLLFFEQNFSAALPYFESAIDEAPSGREREMGVDGVYFYKGLIHLNIGQHIEAFDAYNESLRINPDNAWIHYHRGLRRFDQGDLLGAIEDFDLALQINPEYAFAYTSRGTARSALGNMKEAIEDFDHAIDIDPELAVAYNNRGLARTELGDLSGAMKDYDKALLINPEDAIFYLNRGRARAKLGDMVYAIEDYTRGIELCVEYCDRYFFSRGVARGDARDLDGTIVDLTQAIALSPEVATYYVTRGNAYSSKGDRESAIEDYTRALEINPEFAQAYYERGWAHRILGDLEGALDDYTLAIEFDPEYAQSYSSRGDVYVKQDNFVLAIVDYSRAIELNNRYYDYNDRGEAYFALGNYDQALQDFTRAFEFAPELPFISGGLAITQHALGDSEAALTIWQRLLETDSRFMDADWVGTEFNWHPTLVEQAWELIAEFEAQLTATPPG